MSVDFPNITILGGGLLGGSLAMALAGTEHRLRLWARREETVRTARELGIAGATHDLANAVCGADLLVLSVPVGAMPSLISQALEAGLPPGCLVTDVGSVKRTPHLTIPPLIEGRGVHFIGSHPMAGSERNGLEAACADLFSNSACLLTNDEQAPALIAEALDRFWQSVGCRTSWMSAADHDELVARISHLPHIVAASAARICLKKPDEGRFGGGGLRDTTRVAAGNPDMWAEILTENRQALIDPLRATLADLQEIIGHLERDDRQGACNWLEEAKNRRDLLNP